MGAQSCGILWASILKDNTMKKATLLLLLAGLIYSCQKESDWLGLVFPNHFPPPVYNMSDNPVTKDGFELGKRLFYDPILSRDSTISCGSCHIQGSAFTHHGHNVSHGIDDLLGRRNAPPIQNLLWQNTFFWDGGVHNLDMISLNPIDNPVEMDESPVNVLNKLRRSRVYPQLFQKAFGGSEITTARFLQAMSQFQGMLISANSKYDQYERGEATLTTDELAGMQAFNQKCASCHSGELFSDFAFRNNGISDLTSLDLGRYETSTIEADKAKFKTPSLRNIEKTAPYMHDGSLRTLEAVLDHYEHVARPSSALDPVLANGGRNGIQMTSTEKANIILFLKTLTDEEFIRNPLFSE